MIKSQMNLRIRLNHLLMRNQKTLLAFAIPALILFIAYMTRGIFPIADRNVLTIDLYHQYAPFMAELQDKYTTFGSLFYSWAGGLGINFYALFAYYLASPLNILIILFPPAFLTEAILFLTLLKIGLAGACFFIFLRGVWQKENLQMVALGSFYALSAYSLAYSWNIMWLDGIFLLPLILLGLVKLIRDKRYLLYCLSLALVVASNYYISFFIVIFIILYFPVCLFEYQSLSRPKQLFASIGRFAGFSLLAGGISAFLMLPTYFSLKLTSAAGDSIPSTITHYFDLFDYIGQHFMLVPPTIRDGMPNMYCGILSLILIPIYFFARSISLKQKIMHLVLILVMILSFNTNVLNFIWHGFHFPNQLPYRNSFVYIFLILSMAYPALESLKEFSGKQIGAICASMIGLVLLAQKLNDKPLHLQTLYVTIIFIVIYAAVLTLDRIRTISANDLALALLVVVIAEILLNTLVTVHTIDTSEYYSSREGYFSGKEVDQIREELANIKASEANFYRVECLPPRTINDGFMYNYAGLSIFASTMPTKPVKTFEHLGYHSNSINSYKYEGSTIVLDSLFGIKYLIYRSGKIDDRLRQSYVKTEELEIFKNPYALSIGYLGTPELKDWTSASVDPFISQNSLVAALTGIDPVFLALGQTTGALTNMDMSSSYANYYNYDRSDSKQESMVKINIINEKDQQLYLYLDVTPNKPDRGYVMVDDKRIDFNAKRSTLVELGFVNANAKVEFCMTFDSSSSDSGQFKLFTYALDQTAFAQAYSKLSQQSLNISKFTATKIEGTVDTVVDGVFMMSIPYDEGWQIQVDGKTVKPVALDGGLISFNLTAGQHQIAMKFVPPWFFAGLLISLASIIILLVIYLIPGGPGRRDCVRPGKRHPDIRTVQIPENPVSPDRPDECDE